MRWISVFLFLLVCGRSAFAADCAPEVVDLKGDWGSVRFSVEIADTVEERALGLMHRQQMERQSGMLFVYDAPQRVAFWMKNTLIPLDMIFMDASGRVMRVHHNAIPHDLTGIDGGDNILAVLEINGGLARNYGISAGTVVRHPVFSDQSPAWPC